jgi:hypothetical protein
MNVGNNKFRDNICYKLGVEPVTMVDCARALHVTADCRLKFDIHNITNVVVRASARANLIHTCFLSKDIAIMTRTFACRPVCVRYSNTRHVCGRFIQSKNIKGIEQVQKPFSKGLPGPSLLSYSDILKCVELDSLELRRLKLDLVGLCTVYERNAPC